MKKLHFVLAAALFLLVSSCKKDEETTPTTNNNNNNNNNVAGPQPPMPMPSGNSLSGALISIKMKYTSQPTGAPMPVDLESQIGAAVFYSAAGGTTKVAAGGVTVNNNTLEKQTDNSYMKWAYTGGTPSTLGFATTSKWEITGNSDVAAFTYDHSSSFPDYSPAVPSSITKANGITFTFNSQTLDATDSVYVVIAAGSKTITKSYAGNAGTVTIPASELSSLPTISDNSGVLEVCPFRWVEQVFNGKNYVFIKEQAIVRSININ